MNNDILFETKTALQGEIGVITLNRPSALNALTQPMIRDMTAQLTAWAKAPGIVAVWVQGNGEKAFCAGGDIKQLYLSKQQGDANLSSFFKEEYHLNQLIHHYPKPYLSFLHGITMGGGAGISINGQYRIMVEKAVFAMPETGIGFFPDVGGSYFLSRLPGQLGRYLGLTGARLQANDSYYAGIATHLVAADQLPALQLALLTEDLPLADLLNRYHQSPVTPPHLALQQVLIDSLFAFDTVEQILHACENNDHPFAQDILGQLKSKSPTSLKVTLEQLIRGSQLDFDPCMAMEFHLASHFLTQHDFFEGIRAAVIDKDYRPKWQPAELSALTPPDLLPYFDNSQGIS